MFPVEQMNIIENPRQRRNYVYLEHTQSLCSKCSGTAVCHSIPSDSSVKEGPEKVFFPDVSNSKILIPFTATNSYP